jgi:hypothetical protein
MDRPLREYDALQVLYFSGPILMLGQSSVVITKVNFSDVFYLPVKLSQRLSFLLGSLC